MNASVMFTVLASVGIYISFYVETVAPPDGISGIDGNTYNSKSLQRVAACRFLVLAGSTNNCRGSAVAERFNQASTRVILLPLTA